MLSGVGGLLAQFAQQTEAQELKALLVGIDEKLDDVRRAQRDQVLARVQGAADAIEEAMTIRDHGGDPQTLWDKVSSVDKTIKIAQDEALRALGALAAKVDGKTKAGELKKATHEIEQQAVVWLSVLARCTQLQDEFGVVELDHVLATAAGHLEGHRLGLAAARETQRARLLETTRQLVAALQNAGAAANENIVLHRWSVQAVIESLNATVAEVDSFHVPLRVERSPAPLTATPWRQAIRDPQQRKTAGKEVAQKGVVAVAGAAVAALGAAALVRSSDDEGGTE